MEIFSKRLKVLRSEKGLTQENLGTILHKNRNSIAGYESRNQEPDFEFLCLIADFFDVSIDYLLGRTDIRKPENEAVIEEQILLSALRKASTRDAAIIWQLLEPYISPSQKEILLHLNQADSKTKPD